MLRKALGSPTFVAAAVFTAGGVAFAVANILLGRLLAPAEYGVLALFLALNQLGMPLGVAGLNVVVNRYRTRASARLLLRVGATGLISAALIVAVGAMVYALDGTVLALLLAAVLASSLNRAGAAFFQAEQRTAWMLFLEQWHNYILLATVPIAIWFAVTAPLPVVSIVAAGYAVSAALAWTCAARLLPRQRPPVPAGVALREGLSAMGIALAAMALSQAERLVIPVVLSLELLGAYAVLAAFVGSPFRMLQTGIVFTLLPRLNALRGRPESLDLLLRESAVAAAFVAVMIAALWWFAPIVFDVFLQGEYEISRAVIVAALIVGCVKVWQGLVNAAVQGLGSPRALLVQNVAGWVALVIAVLGAAWASRWGLVGVIYAVGAGWLALALVGTVLAFRHARGD